MLLRLALSIKDKKLEAQIEKKLDEISDLQIRKFGRGNGVWQSMVRSCADIFLISDAIIPKPVESGLAVLNNLPEKPMTIVINAKDSSEDQAQLLAAGADAVLYSGISIVSLIEAMETILESRRQFNLMDRYDRKGRLKPSLNDFVSDSHQMQIFMEEVHQVVTSNSTLLILGETGVGKEHLARAIHAEGPRSNGPFIAVNTAGLPEQLLETELFGHEQGAFTGAIRARRGAFELAHGGTIFLDEIGDMPLHLQTKLLRVLQDYEIVTIGGEEPVWVDVRVIAATNKDLEMEIEQGRFRRDLFYRISVVSMTIPSLCRRREDIPALIRNFISYYRKRIGREVAGISDEAVSLMSRYDWPGNVRELMNVIERAMLLCRGHIITSENLPEGILNAGAGKISLLKSISANRNEFIEPYKIDESDFKTNCCEESSIKKEQFLSSQERADKNYLADNKSPMPENFLVDCSSWESKTLPEVTTDVLMQVEKRYINMVLKKSCGRVGKAAEMAGIHQRGLFNKMKQFGIRKEDFKN
ncbi:Sigma-54 dependent two component DNA-binding response regulator (Fis family protein) [Desulfamplus magnetovallimortis]|uniref:Sigma-54 dependent two component DNA-binding response regulator (Fis family protein) n=1 Tax=Desulfamplus magnetovallimortis TaxID=1246637 RepID=A0A1W1HF49_9BACT|nr:sigma-54 dependent transcriptional regulator [Desulfamplus magnetovallimortis]SLM31002.1 Sigma-54 dependent two component DNA-binding response regulator (Fis family protein) [Desulfamplus magnetovallimortis]